MRKIKVIFIGTGSLGCPILHSLINDGRVELPFIITGQDKPQGRKMQMQANEIKKLALLNNLIVHQPVKSISELNNKIVQASPDFLLLTAFGQLIPSSTLALPKIAPVNIHWSLLPKYRGASPIQSVILHGDKTTGITWMTMNEKMDEGDIITQEVLKIEDTDSSGTLTDKMTKIAAEKTVDILLEYTKKPHAQQQNHAQATYTHKISKQDGKIDFLNEDAGTILRKIRAYTPWPGCFTFVNNRRLKILKAEEIEQKIDPGKMLINSGNHMLVGTPKGTLKILEVQPEGKRRMRIDEFLRGLPAETKTKLQFA